MTSEPEQPPPPAESLPRSKDFDAPSHEFSAVAWVNHALSQQPSIPTLLEQTEEDIRQAHILLDTSLKKALSTVPWVVRETERVRQRANNLRASVDGVGERVHTVETAVVSSVTTLAQADTIVRRVQTASDLLSQAVSAERLLTRLDALLASSAADGSDLVTAADVVSQLRKTLAPLQPISELSSSFASLDTADAKLESLAAPQLQKALESRNTQAAANARIVFDHAGRDKAFHTQYVTLRSAQIASIWTGVWEAKAAAITEEEKEALSGAPGDLAGQGAEQTLSAFYGALNDMLREEAEWLQQAFPDLRDSLLPSLLVYSLKDLKSPAPVVRVEGIIDMEAAADRLAKSALTSVRNAARIVKVFLPNPYASYLGLENAPGSDLLATIVDAITALQNPFQMFWRTNADVATKIATNFAKNIVLSSLPDESVPPVTSAGNSQRFRPTLGDLAKDVQNATATVLTHVDASLATLNSRTCGVGIVAMKQATKATASVLSDRFLKALRLPPSPSSFNAGEDEWHRVSNALRLLCAVSTLKRSWDARKESIFAVAVGTATPVLEIASLMGEVGTDRIVHFLKTVDEGQLEDAGVIWELARDSSLTPQVVSAFESLDSSRDFDTLVSTVHQTVYDCMFAGIKERLCTLSARDLWSGDGSDGEAALLGISSSPLGYATEVADYLMTIPQQLEPFVPDEEDAPYATPKSACVFSTNKAARTGGAQSGAADGADAMDDDDDSNLSFAGMWISVLAIGTMELYVEKICAISRLTEAGTRQLATDVDYICNVIASLGVNATAEIELVRRLLECRADSAALMSVADGAQGGSELRKLTRKIGALRGISLPV